MSFFTPLEGSVLLRFNGAYTEAPLAECDNQLYARSRGTYTRLLAHGCTSRRNMFWNKIELDQPWHESQGRVHLGSAVVQMTKKKRQSA